MRIGEIEDLEVRIENAFEGAFDVRGGEARFFDGDILFEDRFSGDAAPFVLRRADADFNLGVSLQFRVDFFLRVRAEPELSVPFAGEDEGTTFRRPVATDGRKENDRMRG